MNPVEKELVSKRYSERARCHGDSPLTLGWTKGRHFLRYHMLLSQWQFDGDSLLDFGCGFGDLYDYIQRRGWNLSYRGYDINPDLIAIGKKKYPRIQLSTEDIFETGSKKSFDFAVSSG